MPNHESEIANWEHRLNLEWSARHEAEAIAERITQQLHDQQKNLLLLQAVTVAASDSQSALEAIRLALRKICEHAGWFWGRAYLPSRSWSDSLETVSEIYSREADEFIAVSEQADPTAVTPLARAAYKSGKAQWESGIHPDTKERWPLGEFPTDLCASFAFPLLTGSKAEGVLEFFANHPEPMSDGFADIMSHVGAQIGRALERQWAREEILRSERYFRQITDCALDLITILETDGTIRYESHSIKTVLGYDPEDYRGKNAFEFVHPEDVPKVSKAFMESVQSHGHTPLLSFRFRHKDGSWRILEGMGNNQLDDPVVKGVIFNSRDITERRKLEEQFFQAQKVQAIGQLAGGVAHDFNNILTAIIGYGDLVLNQLDPAGPVHGNALEIKKAAERASSLTRQLLAFSRKQVLDPKVLDLNEVLAGMDKMLRRLLGEQIDLLTIPGEGIGHVRADPGQIEQVIMNLAVNARDAMPDGGKLTVELGNVTLDEDYARPRQDVVPGEYVMLAISDNGMGMGAAVLARLFEPFFTTKETGKGTGLGLATCHGIVKQSRGHIAVYSELNQGTTFKVYLPRVEAPVEAPAAESDSPKTMPKGRETILLVEDEPMLRELGIIVLADLGYRVLPAVNGVNALEVIQEHGEQAIDIVVTDVVMPEMGGKELVGRIQDLSPRTKALFCSGYTEDAITRDGMLDTGINFLQKPYTVATLARKVRSLLDA